MGGQEYHLCCYSCWHTWWGNTIPNECPKCGEGRVRGVRIGATEDREGPDGVGIAQVAKGE